ncbi:hypothetical protein ONZ51_g5615 [Trametes cubensis]|uniref:Uncharacterized protein n=1 Tax=Trametes cubensis TaxID=1111947 RepID=A0AAD7TTU0_9APHY|nr:hypothetical protein ONZ51_g5615 [Trametes cubensis]
MVAWQDPSVVAICASVYSQNAIFLLGFFGSVLSARDPTHIEWSLITRKRRFTPALIPYLWGRYAILVALFFFVIQDLLNYRIACNVAYKALAFLGSSASFCSTLNLGIRSYIIWRDMNKIVVWLLSAACVGHAALVGVQGAQSVASTWSEQAHSCIVIHSSNITMFTFYLYTVLMDLTILILTICGLWRKAALRSDIGTNLSEQCLWYCAATFLINIPAAVLPILNLNVIMNVMLSMSDEAHSRHPATTVSVIMSSAAVLSLQPDHLADGDTTVSTAVGHRDVRDRARRRALGIAMQHSRSHQVTLTTNIVLDGLEVNSSEVNQSFDVTTSRKSTEATGAP